MTHRFFQQCKYSSFQRQLHLYGFSRFSVGLDRGGYYHPSFLRGQPELCLVQMRRIKIKGTGVRQSPSPESEPDFYSMPFCHEASIHNGSTPSATTTYVALNEKLPLIWNEFEKMLEEYPLDEDPLIDPTPLPLDGQVLAEQGYPQHEGRILIPGSSPPQDDPMFDDVMRRLSRGEHF